MNTPRPFASAANSGATAGAQPPAGRARQWKVIAQEVSGEEDPAKLTKLIAGRSGSHEAGDRSLCPTTQDLPTE